MSGVRHQTWLPRATWRRSGDLAAEVLERERRLFDECARLVPAAEEVRAWSHRLDPHRPDGIDVALDDELIAEHQAPKSGHLTAVLASRASEVVVHGAPAAGTRAGCGVSQGLCAE